MTQPRIPKIQLPGRSALQLKTPLRNVTLNPEGFEELIKSQGVRMFHQRPVPCPNVRDLHGDDHSPACNLCFNGFVYYDQREFIGAFQGNTLDRRFGANGTWDLDQATIIIPVRDQAEEIIDVQYFDQIIIPDFTVRYYQRVEHSQTGIDRLQFPAISVDFIADSSGNIYTPGIDVIVDNGRLKWISNNRPGYDATLKRGIIYSVNYYTAPVFSIINLPHQLRMVQTQGSGGPGTPNVPARFPQLAVVRKDFIPFDQSDRIGAPDRPEPASGSIGPGPHIRPEASDVNVSV